MGRFEKHEHSYGCCKTKPAQQYPAQSSPDQGHEAQTFGHQDDDHKDQEDRNCYDVVHTLPVEVDVLQIPQETLRSPVIRVPFMNDILQRFVKITIYRARVPSVIQAGDPDSWHTHSFALFDQEAVTLFANDTQQVAQDGADFPDTGVGRNLTGDHIAIIWTV
jgi:hypothetical protein